MKKKRFIKTRLFFKFYSKMFRLLGVLFVIAIIAALMQPLILKTIKTTPVLDSAYNYIRFELGATSLLWLFIVAFVGGLFFVALPIDFLFLYYLISDADPWYSLLAAFIGISLSRILDFWFGHLFREYTHKHVINKDEKMFRKEFTKLGSSILFFGNFIPFFPMELFIVFIGTTDYKFTKYLLYQCLGKLLKLLLIVLLVKFFISAPALLSFNILDFFKSISEQIIHII